MLTAKPTGLLSKNFIVSKDGVQLCKIEQSGGRERAEFVADGEKYVAKNELLGGDFLLEHRGQIIARADKRALRRVFDVMINPGSSAERSFELKVGGIFGTGGRYTLEENGRKVGELVKTPFVRSAQANLPQDVPLPVQAFLLWIGLMMWRRERNSG